VGNYLSCAKVSKNLSMIESTILHTEKVSHKHMQTNISKGRGRGFASMSPEKKREIASKGGKAAHAMGTAHKWTSEEAQAAGRKGGSISRRRPRTTLQAHS
jgi:general stress protein YciG